MDDNSLVTNKTGRLVIREPTEDLFKFFIKSVPASIAVLDDKLHFIIASDRFYEASGLNEAETVGRYHYDVVPDMPEKWKDIHARCLNGEHLKCDEDSFVRADGATVEWWRWEVLPWYSKPEIIGGMILLVENITEQKNIEIKNRQLIKALNKSNKSLSTFARVCAHDLTEPLRTISNYIQVLIRYGDNQFDDTMKTYLNVISDNATYMGMLLQGIFNYSQVNIKKLKYEKFPFDAAVKVAQNALKSTIKCKEATIKLEGSADVYADKILITQVIQNLLNNAIKFNISDNPQITVKLNEQDFFSIISVQDNGIGIDPKNWQKIFSEFVRLHSKSSYKGTGIGLAQCKKIIEDHGGKIWVKSKKGIGSTFYFTLPRKKSGYKTAA